MTPNLIPFITRFAIALAVVATLGAWVFAAQTVSVGVMVGAGVALSNWVVLRWLALNITRGSVKRRAALSMVLAIKLVVMMTLCGVIMSVFRVNAVGFSLGLSTLVMAIFLATIWSVVLSVSSSPTSAERWTGWTGLEEGEVLDA